MQSAGDLVTRIRRSLTELLNYRTVRSRIRFPVPDAEITETSDQAMLRRRIRASALVLFVAKLAFTTRSLVLTNDASALDAATLLILLFASVWLYSPRNVPTIYLRTIECIIFLGMSAEFGFRLHSDLQFYGSLDRTTPEGLSLSTIGLVVAVKDQIIATFGMMMIYGMFIPNTAIRAAVMVLLMAVIPGFVIAANDTSPETFRRLRDLNLTSGGLFSGNLLALAVGAGVVMYGTAIVNRWRTRALEAEQLGQYTLRRKLGSGGMGDVFLAEHRLLKRLCAVKLIREDLSQNPVILKRFEREVRATAALTHWNTVQVFDYGQTAEGIFFYVMEHLHGRNLKLVVTETGPMSEPRVVFILSQICDALREAGRRGLVHRDIKPSNVFLAAAGERFDVVKLLDFGLVRPLTSISDGDLSGANEIKGSPRYMCPEQAQGLSPDTRGDLYSLGAVAYYLLSGRPPFDLQNPLQLIVAHAAQKPAPLSEIDVEVSAALEAVVMKCLQKDPRERFQTPDEMLAALEQIPLTHTWSRTEAETWWKQHFPKCLSDPEQCPDTASPAVNAENADFRDASLEETVLSQHG
ncbi:MAG: serine/threonine protein kinase [Planctomycetaceae bacterium]|nr:serine/threonine protein kinase [Planctomycetaceae bacterium]